jgi:hypothetical protein
MQASLRHTATADAEATALCIVRMMSKLMGTGASSTALASAVRTMRKRQDAWFAARNASSLTAARAAERIVDDLIDNHSQGVLAL